MMIYADKISIGIAKAAHRTLKLLHTIGLFIVASLLLTLDAQLSISTDKVEGSFTSTITDWAAGNGAGGETGDAE